MANEFVIKNGFISQGDSLVNGTLTATTISATTYQNLPVDPNTYITGFTYNNNTFTLNDSSGSTFNASINIVTGFTVNGDLTVTGNTSLSSVTATTISATTYQNLPVDPNTYITGFTYSSNTFTINDNSGNTFNATINTVTGWTVNGDLTVTGNTSLSSVTATTISATTYQNLPSSQFTGGTVSGATNFTGGLTANTISATTYQNLPVNTDTYVTAFTYSNNTFTLNDNSGNTFNATLNTVTGITINGDLSVTGATNLTGGLTANTISASTITGTTFYGDGSNLTGISGGWTIIVKSANQDVTNSATLTDDTDLQFSVVAGGHYMIEMDIVISANNTTGDYKNAFFVSSGTMLGKGFMIGPTATGVAQVNEYASNASATSTIVILGSPLANIDYLVSTKIIYSFQASANAILSYQFGNNAAAAGRISRTWKGSILKYKRID